MGRPADDIGWASPTFTVHQRMHYFTTSHAVKSGTIRTLCGRDEDRSDVEPEVKGWAKCKACERMLAKEP